jgi:flagellar basal-body rod protein FlgC
VKEEEANMSLITALDVSATGLTAQRKRVELSSANLANSQTTRTEEGGPYRRKDVVFQTTDFRESLVSAMDNGVQGVEVSEILDDPRPFERRYEPGHPDADGEGYVAYPNVDTMAEMANLVEGSRSYQANLAAMSIVKAMINRTLDLGK